MFDLLFNASMDVLKYIYEGKFEKLQEEKCLGCFSENDIINTLSEYGETLDVDNIELYKKVFNISKSRMKIVIYSTST